MPRRGRIRKRTSQSEAAREKETVSNRVHQCGIGDVKGNLCRMVAGRIVLEEKTQDIEIQEGGNRPVQQEAVHRLEELRQTRRSPAVDPAGSSGNPKITQMT